MYPYEQKDLITAFQAAPNLNAALKGFLKSQVQKADQTSKFIKSFRASITSKSPGALESFIENSLPRFERHFFLIGRHALSAETESILDQVIEKYADDFNKTYQSQGSSISVNNRDEFNSIAKQALRDLDGGLEQSKLPNNNFMRNVLVYSLFDEQVMGEIPEEYFS